MVWEITRDIQALDQAKRNLTWSITTLNNLVLLITAVDRLKALLEQSGSRLPYEEIASHLGSAQNVLSQFATRFQVSDKSEGILLFLSLVTATTCTFMPIIVQCTCTMYRVGEK